MTNRVRVRRDRPSAPAWALALAMTMLFVYLITLSAPSHEQDDDAEETSGCRITQEITLDGQTAHFAALGHFESASEARIAAAQLAQRGAAGTVLEEDSAYLLLIACYESEGDAARIAAQLGKQESLEASVVSRTASAVSMRVTAPAGDAQRISSADLTLQTQLRLAGSTALQLDRGEISAASARTLAAVARSEVLDALENLGQIAGSTDNPVCSALTAQLESLADAFGQIAQSSASSAALSGQLRCCQVVGTLQRIDFLKGLQ